MPEGEAAAPRKRRGGQPKTAGDGDAEAPRKRRTRRSRAPTASSVAPVDPPQAHAPVEGAESQLPNDGAETRVARPRRRTKPVPAEPAAATNASPPNEATPPAIDPP